MNKKSCDRAVVCYIFLAAVLILAILKFDQWTAWIANLWNVAFPLILGAALAYILNLVMVRLEKHVFSGIPKLPFGVKRAGSIVLSLVLVAAVFFLIGTLVLPELGNTFRVIAQSVPGFLNHAAIWLEENSNAEAAEYLKNLDWNSIMEKMAAIAKSGVSSVLNSTITVVGSVVGGAANFLIGLIFGIYILAGKEKLREQVKRILRTYLKKETVRKMAVVMRTANETFASFIIGQCTEAVVLGVLTTAGMLLFRFPYAPMIGAFIGVTALIPIVGAYLGAAVGVFMILTVDPLKAVLFLLFILIVQQLEGNLIYPRVVGASIGLPGIWVLAAVTIGGGLMGIMGMLLGVPAAATLYKLLKEDVKRRNTPQTGSTKGGGK